jgi:hypothetical protein
MSDTSSAPEGDRRGNAEILNRLDDVTTTVQGLVTRVTILEQGSAQSTDELRINTRLTKQSHEAMFGRDDDPGVKAMVEQMSAMLGPAQTFFEGLGKMGRAGVRISDVIEKRPKTLLSLIVAAVATYSLSTTGKLPEWAGWLVKLLSA